MNFKITLWLLLLLFPSVTPAQWMTATLPDGRSEISSVTVGDNIYFVGGATSGTQRYFKMNIYNVPTDTWTTIDVPNGTMGPRTIAVDNKIYFGDIEGDRTIYIYSIDNGSWEELDVPGFIGTLTYLDRTLIVENNGDLMLYNIDTDTWTKYDFPHQSATVTATNGKIAIGGGYPNLVRIYDVAADTWSESTLSMERFDIRSASYQNKMFFIGGDTTGTIGSVSRIDIYDTESDTWSIDSMSLARSRFDVTIHDGKLIIAGGQIFAFSQQFRREVDILDLNTNTWETVLMPTARRYPSVIGHGDKIYIAGGESAVDNLDIIEILSLETTKTQEIPSHKSSVYPNPAFDKLTLASDYSVYCVEIFDIQGRCAYLADHLFGHTQELDLTSLVPGIYYLDINHRQEQMMFLKQ
jgi:hypothetical protein